jgi:hypothetical protein
MIFPQAKDNLFSQKGMVLLVGIGFGVGSMRELIWPGSIEITVDEGVVGPQDGLAYYGTLWAGVLVSLTALVLFWWLHRRVRRVIASELGLQIMSKPVDTVKWSEVHSVKKELPNFLSGFYLVALADGTEFYTPIERAAPRLSTLGTWYDAPTSLEQLCIKKGVWVQ